MMKSLIFVFWSLEKKLIAKINGTASTDTTIDQSCWMEQTATIFLTHSKKHGLTRPGTLAQDPCLI